MTACTHHTPGCAGAEKALCMARDYNRRVGNDLFAYLVCPDCGLIRLKEPPAALSKYYREDYYALPSAERLERLARGDRCRIETILRLCREGRLLEIGPAFGVFARQAKEAGFEVDVIEMNARCCAFLRDQVGVHAVCSDEPESVMSELGPHDVVVLWHVIEHLADPWRFMRVAADNLKEGGVLVLATPNPESWQFSLMGRFWPHLDAPRHLYLLPEKALTRAAALSGLERVYFTTTDREAMQWNRFGWQRLLMNPLGEHWLKYVALMAGAGLSILTRPFEGRGRAGSSYTVAYRKGRAS